MAHHVVGRERELRAIDEFLAAVPAGVAALALEGEPGIGKTTLWRDGCRRAAEHGLLVLSCRPASSETPLSFAGLGDLLEPVASNAFDALPEPQLRVLEVALLRTEPDGPPPDRRTVSVASLTLVRSLAASAPVVLAVDDAQWLDAATAAVLEFVVRRLDADAVGIFTTVRLTAEPVSTFDRDLGARRALNVGPMGVGALHELLAERLGHSFPRPTLLKIEQAAGGNPFYALEIARELLLVGEPRAGEPLPVPGDLRKLVLAHIRRLPKDTREALLTASMLSEPTTELVDETALAAAEEAEIVRVAERGVIEFTHPLFASAVYSSASSTTRRRLHRSLAGRVDNVEEGARHLSLATTAPDDEVAWALEQGATQARLRGAWDTAALLLERARELTPPDRAEQGRRRGIRAAAHHLHEGNRRRAKALLEEIVADAPPGPVRGDALRLLAVVCHSAESYHEAARLFEEALEHVEDPEIVSIVELGISLIYAMLFDLEASSLHAQRGLEQAEAAGKPELVAEALTGVLVSDFFSGRGVDQEQLERALALEDPTRIVPLPLRPSSTVALYTLFIGAISEARGRLLELRRITTDRGDESELGFYLAWLVWLETLSGNFDTAAAYAEEAALLVTLTAGATTETWVLAHRGLLHAHRGDVAEARRDHEDAKALAERTGLVSALPWIAAARSLLELSLGDADAAWAATEPLTQVAEGLGIGEPVLLPCLPDALEALVARGELDRAEALVDRFERRGQKLERPWALATAARSRGLLLAARGDLPGAEAALQHALAEHERMEMPFELARTLLCLGQIQRRRKERKAARETLGNALEIFETVGAPLWSRKAQSEIRRIGVRRAPTELTAGEQAVAELAATGLTNREIAARLFMSRRTVEANLARVYTKLEIRSRAELGAKMATRVN